MNKTPCEKLGYNVGDKFVNFSHGEKYGGIFTLKEFDAAGVPFFMSDLDNGCYFIFSLSDVSKIDSDGWIEWKGGEMPVERGTLVDVKYRDGAETIGVTADLMPGEEGYFRKGGVYRNATDWACDFMPYDIVAYRLHKPEQQSEVKVVIDATRHAQPTIDQLLQAWQQAKAATQRAEQDEAAARKAVDDALRAAGWGVDAAGSLDITDWRDLQPGDIVWVSSRGRITDGEYPVVLVEPRDYTGHLPFAVEVNTGAKWVNTDEQQWRFIRRPA
ncbi:hypothetical protein [Edwardsiella piscicida]|uniref:hypothetical protein n=1 Tax=Edwardsiella piscicida TaxID=1263550 RepID=UPI00370D1497